VICGRAATAAKLFAAHIAGVSLACISKRPGLCDGGTQRAADAVARAGDVSRNAGAVGLR
jgi:hypothetical protein